MRTLRDVPIGETAKVVKLHGEGSVKRRIMRSVQEVVLGELSIFWISPNNIHTIQKCVELYACI